VEVEEAKNFVVSRIMIGIDIQEMAFRKISKNSGDPSG
jgi:hypothetical protein